MCDNEFNNLGSPNIFHGFRYREWMHEVWESCKFMSEKLKKTLQTTQMLHFV